MQRIDGERNRHGRLRLDVAHRQSWGQNASSYTYRKPAPAVRLGGLAPLTIECLHIRESVDSLCRDGADTDTPIYQMKRLITPERYSYKPFQTYNKALRVFLYHIRPSKYVKYTYTMTYGNCHTSVFEYFFIIFFFFFFFFFFKRSTSKLTNALTFILA